MVVSTLAKQESLRGTWDKARGLLRQRMLPDDFDTWFEDVSLLTCDEETVRLGVPGSFRKDWIERSYGQLLAEVFRETLRRSVRVEVTSRDEEISQVERERDGSEFPPIDSYQTLHSRYKFENFVVGMSNKMTHAGCLSVARNPSESYNPLFIYGGVGLGKTHLMQAIGHYVLEHHPHLRFVYISAIKRNERFQFQSCFRGVDVLLIDDIHFLAGKEGTQEEFFHTFNDLHNNRKQIVISSDKPPKEIQKLEERLRSRFEWGLITEISSPDYETRLAILQRKADEENIRLPNDVLEEVATNVTSSIRELESALVRLGAHVKFSNTEMTLDITKKILSDLFTQRDREVSIDKIQKRVAEHFRIKASDIMGRGRSRSVVLPRQIAMYLSRKLTNHSLPEIGTFFGNKDHTTVLFAYRKIEKQIEEEAEFGKFIQEFIDSFG